jgi:hypothetical protein
MDRLRSTHIYEGDLYSYMVVLNFKGGWEMKSDYVVVMGFMNSSVIVFLSYFLWSIFLR